MKTQIIFRLSRYLVLLAFLGLVQEAVADPPGVIGESQEAEGVRGIGHKGVGVSGTSEKWLGVYGESQEAEGVHGVGHKGAGVSGGSDQWIGVFGTTKSTQAAGGEFQNTGGGDLVRAGQNGAFRVLNNGDVLVRGQKIGATGATGPQGPVGPMGPKGEPGPISRAGCMCSWQSTSSITNQCGAPGVPVWQLEV